MLAAQIQNLTERRAHLQEEFDYLVKMGADNTEVVAFTELNALSTGAVAPLDLSAGARQVIHQIALNDLGQRLDEVDRQLAYLQPREQVSS